MASGRAREYHINGFCLCISVFPALATLHYVVHEDSALLPRILNWRCNTAGRFHEPMSLVFENNEVEVKLVRPLKLRNNNRIGVGVTMKTREKLLKFLRRTSHLVLIVRVVMKGKKIPPRQLKK